MEFNNAFFEQLGGSPAVEKLVVDAAQTVAAAARSSAPVGSGDYRDRIRVQVIRHRRLRTVALVVAEDPKSLLVEAKTGNLARALQRVKRGR